MTHTRAQIDSRYPEYVNPSPEILAIMTSDDKASWQWELEHLDLMWKKQDFDACAATMHRIDLIKNEAIKRNSNQLSMAI